MANTFSNNLIVFCNDTCTCYRWVGSACSSPTGLPKLDIHCTTACNYPSIPSSPGLTGDKKDRRKERSEVLPRHSSAHIYNNWANRLSSNKASKPFDSKHEWNKRFVLNHCHRLEFAFELPKAVPGEARLTQFQVSSSCWETSPAWASGCIPHLQPTSGNESHQCDSTPGNPIPLWAGEKAVKQRGHPLTSNKWLNSEMPAGGLDRSLRRLESALPWRYMKYVHLGAALLAPQG